MKKKNSTSSTPDAVLVPGGGIKNNRELPPWVQQRFDRALEIHQKEYIIALSAGTTHKPPPLDINGFPVFESTVGADYLIKKGVDPRWILCETASYDTIGNAYFSRVIHVDPRGFKQLLIITSASHMPRTKAIFQWVYGLKSPCRPNDYTLTFDEVPDQGMDKELLQVRIQKEQKSLENVLRLKEKIRTFEDFHRWLFTEHGAYSVSVPPQRLKGKILQAY
ncbi:MAG: YdcF family protein [Candidatus Aminicenantes bacterium]|nr:MAG: YdcF family protein [Candidatus Aminicenantes bacterium]